MRGILIRMITMMMTGRNDAASGISKQHSGQPTICKVSSNAIFSRAGWDTDNREVPPSYVRGRIVLKPMDKMW